METIYFLSYIALAILFISILAAGALVLLMDCLRQIRPWEHLRQLRLRERLRQLQPWGTSRDGDAPQGGPHEPIARFPSRP